MQLLRSIFPTLLTSTQACYHWTKEDLVAIKAGGSGPNAERPVCESHGHVFTQGFDECSFTMEVDRNCLSVVTM